MSTGGATLAWHIWYQFLLQFSVSVLMWHWYSDRGVPQSEPPKRRVDICYLWGPVTWNYRLHQVLSISFFCLHLLPLHLPFSSSPLSSLLIFSLCPTFLQSKRGKGKRQKKNVIYWKEKRELFLSNKSQSFFPLWFFLASFTPLALHLLSSPSPLPLGHKEGAEPVSCSWVLLKLKLCQLACSQALPKLWGSGDLSNT